MKPILRDDNLRLIFSVREREFIMGKYRYQRNNFVTCGGIVIGFLFFLEIYPLLYLLGANSNGLLMLIGVVWGFVGFCAIWIGIIALQKLRKYKNFLQEHQKFMRKYRRSKE